MVSSATPFLNQVLKHNAQHPVWLAGLQARSHTA